MAKSIRKSRAAYLLMLPFLLHFLFVVAYPMFYSLYLSLTEAGLNTDPAFVGLENFTTLAQDTDFRAALGNTFYFAFFAVLGETVLPLVVALVMNQALHGRVIFRTAFFLPVATSWVIVSLMWSVLFSRNGIVNVGLAWVGLSQQPFLGDGQQAMWIIIAMSIWKNLGYYMVIYLAALQSVPQDLVDAASLDGAGPLRVIWNVTIPSIRPVIYFVLSIATIGSMQLFTQPFIMTNGGPLNATLSIVMLLYRKGFVELAFGYGSAIATVLLVLLILLSLLNRRLGNLIAH
ncbi:MAG TPA: sugar ABC transporter permease [Thermomicrobiales bacterium]|nr:sugar ABC transporter permease [Thermomicrobiales bacterium]